MNERMPITGFVLAGGRSSRMGVDKATLRLGGRTLAEIAVETLRRVCTEVSIGGNRPDLADVAPIVPDLRSDGGPAAAVEACLRAASQPWAMFVPVDAPLMPPDLLERWAAETLERAGSRPEFGSLRPCLGSYLQLAGKPHPVFCLLRRSVAAAVHQALEDGERKFLRVFEAIEREAGGSLWPADVERLAASASGDPATWLLNANTPEEWAAIRHVTPDPE